MSGADRSDQEKPEYDSLALEEQVCFALYAASRAVTDAYRPLLNELGLTYPQYLVMLVLWEHGTNTVRGVGDALWLDYGTVSPLLKRLEQRGYVTRRRSAQDERSVAIELTTEGRELRARAEGVPPAIGRATGLDLGQRRELIAALARLTDSVRGYAPAQQRAQQ